MDFLQRVLAWFGTEPANAPFTPLTPDPTLSALTPSAPSLEAQRYSDANYDVSRTSEARKRHVMDRVCAVNNAAAEDVIDRKFTTVRPAQSSRPAAPLTVAEQRDVELFKVLAEVTDVMENDHGPR